MDNDVEEIYQRFLLISQKPNETYQDEIESITKDYTHLLLIAAGRYFERTLLGATQERLHALPQTLFDLKLLEKIDDRRYFKIFTYDDKRFDTPRNRDQGFLIFLKKYGIPEEEQTADLIASAGNLMFIAKQRNFVAHDTQKLELSGNTPKDIFEKYNSAKLFLRAWRKVLGLDDTKYTPHI